MTEMTKQLLRKVCKDTGLYTTPSINDKIYLHYKGFSVIENLEEYTGLKALWLEGNGLMKISGLEHQTILKTLYLHENLIERIEGLDSQVELDCLNLSKNYITHVDNLSHMTKLTSLNLANNAIKTADGIRHLLQLPSLQSVDLQHNKIEDPSIIDIFAQLPDLRVLYLMGNPAVKQIRNYRKAVIYRCKMLKYLDDRPVFEDERRRTEAWGKVLDAGGSAEEAMQAERDEMTIIRREKDEADERNFRAFEAIMREGQEIRRQREAEQAANRVQTEEPEKNPFTGEAIVQVPESADVKKAREERWGVPAVSGVLMPPPPPTEAAENDDDSVGVVPDGDESTEAKEVESLLPPPPGETACASEMILPPTPPVAAVTTEEDMLALD